MIAAARVLGTYKNNRKIAVLGDMKELGEQSLDLHKALAPVIIAEKIDMVVAIGSEMRALYDALPENVRGFAADNAADAAARLVPLLRAGDVVSVKGSHSMRTDIVVDALKAMKD